MRRKERTEILIQGTADIAKDFAKEIEMRYKVNVIQKPESALVLLKARETAKKSLFYLGELLVTECTVQIQDSIGIGIVKGHREELAHCLAIIDAAYQADLVETRLWSHVLENEKKNIQKNLQELNQSILRTKVNFETMDVQ
ncbi:phosphonate C-P lyase system protein PhnG [Peribacillus butanolivorans]|uniref:phosphonate C-P lyase system protein PhnG n=1 Tax=Peribacillus TaxID=2675229 RepID=UPI0006A74C76|nr:phosphonate C-P lyase system protein PhnG [Peribacillus butanolivorans]KON70548.1 phosphonate C-P lyase [Peribacillus butanolivorans]KRF67479.1 phosphonate C-P lyase system protein PhnG [Bacillus sp. Soil768D1]MCO0598142.1 phosphonate C-P lyase system protein PhnG [Peribacillus butanolivorans]MED3687445.1 phosphonate C-P lyase system protein PhnG [Peribacillus butanolivorans]